MLKKITLFLITIFLISSCELKHSNPLDPVGHDIEAPPIVTDIELMLNTNTANMKYIDIEWNDENAQSDSLLYNYIIYRGLSYYGVYNELTIQNSAPYQDYGIISGNRYYYKMSAVNDAGLEGPLSLPKSVQVN